MLGNYTIKSKLDTLKNITGVDFSLFGQEGTFRLSTMDKCTYATDLVRTFIGSGQEYREVSGLHFFSIYCEEELEYVLIAEGNGNVELVGRIAVAELSELLETQLNSFDKNEFYQNLLLDNMLLVDIYNKAKRLHIEADIPRVVFMVELQPDKDALAKQLIKGIYGSDKGNFITALDEKHVILIRALSHGETYEDLEAEAKVLVDMLNTEAMIRVRVSYGTIVQEMKQVSKSYKEAGMALDVGKIFFSEKSIIPYNSLGIGRLIYQLPVSLCEMFMKEVLGNVRLDDLDEETLTTIQKFYENNLNVSETARQLFVHRNTLVYRLEKLEKLTGLDIRVFEDALTLRIALMVSSYMKYIEQEPY